MPGAFHGIDIASRALRSFQRALDVTGNNIANVNTKGYSRQTVDFAETDPLRFWSNGPQYLGSGVTIASLNRVRDLILEEQLLGAESDLGRHATLAAELIRLGEVYGEPRADGIADALNKFFDAWSGLASNPGDAALRTKVQHAGATLAQRVRGAYRQFLTTESQLDLGVRATIARVNEIGVQLAKLNGEIRHATAANGQPNQMLDQRDLLLEELSQLVDVQTVRATDGTIAVHINQFTLVMDSTAKTLPDTYDPVTQTVSDAQGTYLIRSGKLAGQFQSLVRTRTEMDNLDLLANTLRTQVNSLHRTGLNRLGNTNVDFFNDGTPQTGAVDFDLSAAVKANPDEIATGTSGDPGDNGLALSLSLLRSQTLSALGSRTFGEYFIGIATKLGQDGTRAQGEQSTAESVVTQVENQRQSISGVSLDDEMASMLRFQRSYQAAARLLSVLDQVTEDLLGMVRR